MLRCALRLALKACILFCFDFVVDLYIELYGCNQNDFLNMSDEKFDKLIGREIPTYEVTRPYDINTPMRDYKTAGGKFLFGVLTFALSTIYNLEKLVYYLLQEYMLVPFPLVMLVAVLHSPEILDKDKMKPYLQLQV